MQVRIIEGLLHYISTKKPYHLCTLRFVYLTI